MANFAASVDANTFLRTAALFAEKRRTLPPDSVRDLADVVVRRIAAVGRDRPQFEVIDTDTKSLAAFCAVLVQPTADAALRFLQNQRADGITRQEVVFGYIAGASRLLGERWDRDEVTFMDVALATGHLYALMRATRSERSPRERATPHRSALFASVPGEIHNIGITIAADTFREAGWTIDLQLGRTEDHLLNHVTQTRPTIIGLSLSTKERIADLIRLVVALRIINPSAIIGVAPAMDTTDAEIGKVVDIDVVFRDARTAFTDLDRIYWAQA